MENIVKMEDIGDCVARTIRGISEGILTAREGGIQAEFTEDGEISFNMVVVRDFQTLEVLRSENGDQTETEGGSTRETQNGTRSEEQNGTRSEEQNGTRSEEQNETRKTVEASARNESSNREDVSESENRNVHDQKTTKDLTQTP